MIFLSVLCVFVRFSLHTHLLVFTRALYALSRAKKDLGETFQFWYENSILMEIWHYTYFNIRAKILKKYIIVRFLVLELSMKGLVG